MLYRADALIFTKIVMTIVLLYYNKERQLYTLGLEGT